MEATQELLLESEIATKIWYIFPFMDCLLDGLCPSPHQEHNL